MPVPYRRSRMSFSRQEAPFRKYSPSPVACSRRVIVTSSNSIGSARAAFSSVRETSAMPAGPTPSAPLKMTSSISSPRTDLYDSVPRTHLTASTTLDLPHPLGPTMQVTPGSKTISVFWAKDLNPHISSFFSCMSLAPGKTSDYGLRSGERGSLSQQHAGQRTKSPQQAVVEAAHTMSPLSKTSLMYRQKQLRASSQGPFGPLPVRVSARSGQGLTPSHQDTRKMVSPRRPRTRRRLEEVLVFLVSWSLGGKDSPSCLGGFVVNRWPVRAVRGTGNASNQTACADRSASCVWPGS